MKITINSSWYFHGINSPAAENGKPVLETAVYKGSIVHPVATVRIVLDNDVTWPDDPETSRQLRDAETEAILTQLGLI